MEKMNPRLPTIPQYFKQYVDSKVDLETTPQIACPFHDEKTGRSFSYSKQLGIWRCFGACHCGGDVIDLHRLNYRMKTRDEARRAMYSMYGISLKEELNFDKKRVEVNMADVHRRRVYAAAVQLAKTPDDYLELDYIVSKVPYDVKELEVFCSSRGVLFTSE
ncbi:MAG: CHC2 zinc finger domain-containing protein [Lachnospiraceae bacterium]|nr:CHC2 zinc finger domain-containing protein [Lachnospiraceae bacterium]